MVTNQSNINKHWFFSWFFDPFLYHLRVPPDSGYDAPAAQGTFSRTCALAFSMRDLGKAGDVGTQQLASNRGTPRWNCHVYWGKWSGNGWKCGNLKIGEFENCVLRTMPDFGRCSRRGFGKIWENVAGTHVFWSFLLFRPDFPQISSIIGDAIPPALVLLQFSQVVHLFGPCNLWHLAHELPGSDHRKPAENLRSPNSSRFRTMVGITSMRRTPGFSATRQRFLDL